MKQFASVIKVRLIILVSVCAFALGMGSASAADLSGLHAFQNDDRNQFADFWLNKDHNTITIKVSNGRPWRPMWIVLHATFWGKDNAVLDRADFHVFCQSPVPGGHGAERWFIYPNKTRATFANTARIQLDSNKERPWTHPGDGWQVEIPVYPPPSIPNL